MLDSIKLLISRCARRTLIIAKKKQEKLFLSHIGMPLMKRQIHIGAILANKDTFGMAFNVRLALLLTRNA